MSTTSTLRQSLIAGLLALLPLYITFKVISILFELVDSPLGTKINGTISMLAGRDIHIPGLGIIGTLLAVLAIGYLTRIVFFKRIHEAFERVIERVPLVRSLYNASRQIVVPFTQKDALPFSEVVLVEYPMVGRYTIGMIARNAISDLPDEEHVVVFFPSNHLHLGYPVVLSRRDVHPIDMTIEEAVKFFVSCGVVGNPNLFTYQGKPVQLSAKAAIAVNG